MAVSATPLMLWFLWTHCWIFSLPRTDAAITPIVTALGQVLIAYFTAILAIVISTYQAAKAKQHRWTAAQATLPEEQDLGGLMQSVTAALGEEGFTDLVEMITRSKGPDQAYGTCNRVLQRLDQRASYFRGEEEKERLAESIKAVRGLADEHLRQLYDRDLKKLKVARFWLIYWFVINVYFTFIHTCLCFWPDPLLFKTIPYVRNGLPLDTDSLPSVVIAGSVVFMVAVIFVGAFLCLKQAASIHSLGRESESL